eukprot:TRINITY_DN2660_c0_g1_i2.p1 TRINITY_DN2660_c0_g1~~TRINITY_DN2660_c0_g1_i2.p1  ORF type:complete len:192 (-),score=13.70 TRINITY_DN2660_c0_g1_i2:167-742(-)
MSAPHIATFGSVLMGTLGGLATSALMFYTISGRKAFGGVTPMDANDAWQQKTFDLEVDGKWRREAAGPVHLNPIRHGISGRDYALQCLKPAEDEDEDDEQVVLYMSQCSRSLPCLAIDRWRTACVCHEAAHILALRSLVASAHNLASTFGFDTHCSVLLWQFLRSCVPRGSGRQQTLSWGACATSAKLPVT